jgi:hypothetical protein
MQNYTSDLKKPVIENSLTSWLFYYKTHVKYDIRSNIRRIKMHKIFYLNYSPLLVQNLL